jgi:outer membrane protein OmpA-like peptidoglycan-associated protein
MNIFTKPFGTGLIVVTALGACTDPASLNPDGSDPNANRNQGAALGAGIGALAGAVVRDDDRLEGALIGGVVGGAVGAGVGYSLDQQAAELRQQIGNDDVVIRNEGNRLVVTLPQDILFATGRFDVRPDLQQDLRSLAANLQRYPETTVQIIGHTDSDGDFSYNVDLSERRANAVADVLLDSGVAFQRITTIGRGEDQPVASNLTAEGKARNRRVEIIILPPATG